MSSSYDKLTRILALEREQGYRNRAVIGGLERFLGYWDKEARRDEPPADAPPVDEVLAQLVDYPQLSAAERQRTIDGLLARLAPPTPGTPPPSRAAAFEALPSRAQTFPVPTAAQPQNPPDATPVTPGAEATQRAETPPREPAAPAPAPAPRQEPAPSRKAPSGECDDRLTINSPITELKGVTKLSATHLQRMGIRTIRDLLVHVPRRYDDFAQLKTINRLQLGDEVTIVGVVRDCQRHSGRGGMAIVRATISDGTGAIGATWFNQPYLVKQLYAGREIVLSGTVGEYLGRLVFTSPEWEPLSIELLHTARLVPVYPLTEGIKARWLRRLMKHTVDDWAPRLNEFIPQSVLAEEGLMPIGHAIAQLHFPDSPELLARSQERMAFTELFLLQLGVMAQRQAWRSQPGYALTIPERDLDVFVESLPFRLTDAQRRAIGTITADLAQAVPMSRLLQGDVGSGKTVVAAAAILSTVRNGLQAALMAPTSILAEQHYQTLTRLLEPYAEINVALLVGSLSAADKSAVSQQIAAGRAQVVVGTHALIQGQVEFDRLGLVIVDEQHRFGVAERGALRAKGGAHQPHLLAMSATPIPRTLAQTLYGDLDVAALDELPPGRQKVSTHVRGQQDRERIYGFILNEARQGRQVFVICPLVDESEKLEVRAAVAEQERLQKEVFPQLSVGLLHGRMAQADKDQVMADFKAVRYHILVSTAVVEVGIDVPNATVMLVEGADRFGLAQLHQFRGRVGRG
ncbi:MAG: ATP-dependent DNA helicase RecG, partial [Chloroflexi bacterium]|nr:ATP-dependent DNA helicase RecG [Chloroflexota bacterium]